MPHTNKSTVIDFTKLQTQELSRRECEVINWIVEGKRDAEIAIILGISVRTVNHHVRTILRKIGVETRTAAAAFVIQRASVLSFK